MSHLPEDKELSEKRRVRRLQKASQRSCNSQPENGRQLCSYTGERNDTHSQAPKQQESREGVGKERNSV